MEMLLMLVLRTIKIRVLCIHLLILITSVSVVCGAGIAQSV